MTLLEIAERDAASSREFVSHLEDKRARLQEEGNVDKIIQLDRVISSVRELLVFEEFTATKLKEEAAQDDSDLG